QQFVRRLCGIDEGFLRFRSPFVDSVHASVELMEAGMRQPCLVEVQDVYDAVKSHLDLFGVVDDSVVGALRQGEDSWGYVRVDDERVGSDLLGNGLGEEFPAR